MNQLGIERFHLVGTAAGAFVALDFALSFPQRLRTLVIANSIGGVQDEDYLEVFDFTVPPTAELIYNGEVCGPNINADEDRED